MMKTANSREQIDKTERLAHRSSDHWSLSVARANTPAQRHAFPPNSDRIVPESGLFRSENREAGSRTRYGGVVETGPIPV